MGQSPILVSDLMLSPGLPGSSKAHVWILTHYFTGTTCVPWLQRSKLNFRFLNTMYPALFAPKEWMVSLRVVFHVFVLAGGESTAI